MLRPLAEAGEELDREEVEESLHEAADAVLRVAEAAAAVVDLNLAHTEAAGRRQHRDEAVQFTVELHLAKDLRAVTLHAAVVIVQVDAGGPAHHGVEDSAGEDLVPGVEARALPAADNVALLRQ